MKRALTTLWLAGVTMIAIAQQPTMTEWHDLQVNEVNRYPIHTTSPMPASCRWMAYGIFYGWSVPTSVLRTSSVQTMRRKDGQRCMSLACGNSMDLVILSM